jgi:hypothetical protein
MSQSIRHVSHLHQELTEACPIPPSGSWQLEAACRVNASTPASSVILWAAEGAVINVSTMASAMAAGLV